MANKKAAELVMFAEQALKEKWGYVWGSSGEVYTQAIAEKLYNAYKTSKYNETYYFKDQMNLWKNRKVCDCSGLFRAFGASGTANDMYNKSISKGKLSTCDLLPGTLVFCQDSDGKMNHIGVLVDGGYVIHSTNSATGVIKERLSTSKRGWTHWGRVNFIDYGTSIVATSQVKSDLTLEKAEYYTVIKGDTMNKIASKYNTTLAKLKVLNPEIKNIDVINIGQKIKVRQ